MAKAKVELPVLTKAELDAAREACTDCKMADRVAAEAKKVRDGALAQVFFKLGFASMDEVKALEPAVLAHEIDRRVGSIFEIEGKAFAEFAIQKSSQGKYPAWKKELIAINGPAVATQIESETATQYSYLGHKSLSSTGAYLKVDDKTAAAAVTGTLSGRSV
jgi:hypothetical protein